MPTGPPKTGMTIPIITLALFSITEHLIGLSTLLEISFSFGVIWIAVRMILHGKLTIGALDLVQARLSGD